MIETSPTADNIEELLRRCADAAPYPRLDRADWGFRESHRLIEELRSRGEIEAVYQAMSNMLTSENTDAQWLAMEGLPHERLMAAGFEKIDPSILREEGQRVYRSLLAVLIQAGEFPYEKRVREHHDRLGGEALFGVYLAFDHSWFLANMSVLLGPDLNDGKMRLLWALSALSRVEVERFRSEIKDGDAGLSVEWVDTLVDACDSYLNYGESEYNSEITSPRF